MTDTAVKTLIGTSIDAAYTGYLSIPNVVLGAFGGEGIRDFAYNNGNGFPVTDIMGL